MEKRLKRLILRPVREEDRKEMHSILTDAQVKKTYMLPDFETEEQVEKLFLRFIQLSSHPERFVRAIALEGKLIGFLNDVGIENGKIELGYVVSPDCWGRGYCTEALMGAMEWLFEQGFREVVCGAFSENKGSIRVMEKAGMEKVNFTEEIEYRDKIHTCVYYSKRK